MSKSITQVKIQDALVHLAKADRILDELSKTEGSSEDDDDMYPWEAGHVWIFRSMCLLIDSLGGVKDTRFSDDELVPVPITEQPHLYLSGEHKAALERVQKLALEHDDSAKDD